MSKQQTSIEELQANVGKNVGESQWRTVDQQRIDGFAELTEDPQWIHTDPERAAKESPFGATIAHGFLTLSLMTKLCSENGVYPEGIVMGVNYGLDKVRFLNPVRAGKRVRAHTEIMSVDRKDASRFLVKQAVTVEIEGEDTPAVYAEWLCMSIIG